VGAVVRAAPVVIPNDGRLAKMAGIRDSSRRPWNWPVAALAQAPLGHQESRARRTGPDTHSISRRRRRGITRTAMCPRAREPTEVGRDGRSQRQLVIGLQPTAIRASPSRNWWRVCLGNEQVAEPGQPRPPASQSKRRAPLIRTGPAGPVRPSSRRPAAQRVQPFRPVCNPRARASSGARLVVGDSDGGPLIANTAPKIVARRARGTG
jgi:hypothetical protein